MEDNYQEELNKIEKTVQNYIDGVINFNYTQAENSWHPDGVKISYNQTEERLDRITMIQSRPEGRPLGNIRQQAEIKEINRVGCAATALIQWYQEKEGKRTIFTDFLSLLNMNNQWKIVAKVYDTKKLDEW